MESLPIYNKTLSRANGPGLRMVIWTAGCNFYCDGCFNSNLWDPTNGTRESVEDIARLINSTPDIDGITMSGGEPMLYPEAIGLIFNLIEPHLTKIIFTGYTYNELRASERLTDTMLRSDLVIAGRYDNSKPSPYLAKEFIKVTPRVDIEWFNPGSSVEYCITDKGDVTRTGIVPRRV